MVILIEIGTMGADVGPFELYSNYAGPWTIVESGINRSQLVPPGYEVIVPDGTTQVKLVSTGDCTNSIIIDVAEGTTTTSTSTTPPSTTTTSTTAAPVTAVYLSVPIGGFTNDDFCGLTIPDAISAGVTDAGNVYTAYVGVSVTALKAHTPFGYTFYQDSGLTIPFVGIEDYYAVLDDGNPWGTFSYEVYVNNVGGTHNWLTLSCATTTTTTTTP